MYLTSNYTGLDCAVANTCTQFHSLVIFITCLIVYKNRNMKIMYICTAVQFCVHVAEISYVLVQSRLLAVECSETLYNFVWRNKENKLFLLYSKYIFLYCVP